MVPILKRELLEASPTSRLAGPVGQALVAAGYHQQFPVREGFLNAFVVMEGQRRALALSEHELEVRSLSHRISLDDAVAALEADPSAWSPGALLRPLVQDHLLPTAAYVGGPAEIAYHAQLGPAYAHFGIPRPVAFPRPGVTLVESSPARALETEGLTLIDLQADPELLLARWARAANPGIESAFARAREAIARELEAIGAALGALDPTLRAAADSAKGRTLHQVEGLEEKAMRALKKRDLVRAERLRRTRDALFPGGTPQERVLGLVGLVARTGGSHDPRAARADRPVGEGPPGDRAVKIGITCYPTIGGSGAVAAELGKHLARRGHEIHFISYRLPFRLGDFHQNISFHAVDVSTYVLFEYPPHDLALAAKMAEVARERRLDLFHVHYAIPHAVVGFLAQQMLGSSAPKLVTTLHGTDVTLVGQDRSFFEITRFGIQKSDGVTAVSHFLRQMTLDEFQITNGIEVIHNFIDPADYCPSRAYKDRRRFREAGGKDPAAHLELPAGEADHGRGPDLRAGEPRGAFDSLDGRRGPGARLGPGPRPSARDQRTGPLPRRPGEHRGDRGHGRRIPAAVGARVVRPIGPRSDGFRGPGDRLRRRGHARGRRERRHGLSAARRRRGGHGRRAVSRSCATTPASGTWATPAATAPNNSSVPTRS